MYGQGHMNPKNSLGRDIRSHLGCLLWYWINCIY